MRFDLETEGLTSLFSFQKLHSSGLTKIRSGKRKDSECKEWTVGDITAEMKSPAPSSYSSDHTA